MFYLLSEYRIYPLEAEEVFGDLVMEDIIDIFTDKSTKIADTIMAAIVMMNASSNLKYCYSVDIKKLGIYKNLESKEYDSCAWNRKA